MSEFTRTTGVPNLKPWRECFYDAMDRALKAEAALARVEALFSGDPDAACRTTWRLQTVFVGKDASEDVIERIECVEVPLADLNDALRSPETTREAP